ADSGVHTYTLDINSATNAGAYSLNSTSNAFTTNQGSTPAQSGGTLTISSIDTTNKKMTGTFSFKAYRSIDSMQKDITEGVFTNISYTTTLPPPSSTDTFRVQVDGTAFTATSLFGILALNMITITATDASVKSV